MFQSFNLLGKDVYKRQVVDPADDASSDARAVASAAEIQLYDSTSPFAYEHWALVGLEREGEMFSASKTLSDNLTAVFAASLVVGLLIAVVAAWLSSSRLRHLMSEVRAAQPEQPIAFKMCIRDSSQTARPTMRSNRPTASW